MAVNRLSAADPHPLEPRLQRGVVVREVHDRAAAEVPRFWVRAQLEQHLDHGTVPRAHRPVERQLARPPGPVPREVRRGLHELAHQGGGAHRLVVAQDVERRPPRGDCPGRACS